MYQSAFPDNWKHEPPLNVLDSPPILHCNLKQKDRKKIQKNQKPTQTNNKTPKTNKPTQKNPTQTNKKTQKKQTNKNKPTKTKVHFITTFFSLFV